MFNTFDLATSTIKLAMGNLCTSKLNNKYPQSQGRVLQFYEHEQGLRHAKLTNEANIVVTSTPSAATIAAGEVISNALKTALLLGAGTKNQLGSSIS